MKITEEQINRANMVNLPSFLISNGFPLKKAGREFVWQEHDSLHIKDNINGERGKWYRFSTGEGGDNISFLQQYMGKTFVEAVETLNSERYEREHVPSHIIDSKKKIVEKQNIKILEDTESKRIFGYLCGTRGLEYALIAGLVREGKIVQEQKTGNAVFKIFDENNRLVGAEKVGTSTENKFKSMATGSARGYGFEIIRGKGEKAFFFESAIDMLSYLQMKNPDDCRLVSMMGVKPSIVLDTMNRCGIFSENVYLCSDNDDAGKLFAERLMSEYPQMKRIVPEDKYKDWNDMLRGIQNEKERESKMNTYGNKMWNDATDNREKSLISMNEDTFVKLKSQLDNSSINYFAYAKESKVVMAVNDKDLNWLKQITGNENLSARKSNVAYIPPQKNIIGNTEYRYIPNKQYVSADSDTALKMAEIMLSRNIKFSGRIYPNGKATLTVSNSDISHVQTLQQSIAEMRKQFASNTKADEIIGNKSYRDIRQRQYYYSKLTPEQYKEIQPYLDTNAQYSGIIRDSKVIFTVEKEDYTAFYRAMENAQHEIGIIHALKDCGIDDYRLEKLSAVIHRFAVEDIHEHLDNFFTSQLTEQQFDKMLSLVNDYLAQSVPERYGEYSALNDILDFKAEIDNIAELDEYLSEHNFSDEQKSIISEMFAQGMSKENIEVIDETFTPDEIREYCDILNNQLDAGDVTEFLANRNKPELTEKEIAFLEGAITPFMAKSVLAWDEIESIGYRMFEEGYNDKYAPSEKSIYGNGLKETELSDIIRRMNNDEDIRKELSMGLLGTQNHFTTTHDNEFTVEYGDELITAKYENAERTFSYSELGDAFIKLFRDEYNDIVHNRTVEDLKDTFPDISKETADKLINAFDSAVMADWKTNDIKQKKIKSALYNILGDEDNTEKAFASIAEMKYNFKFEPKTEESPITAEEQEVFEDLEAENLDKPTVADLAVGDIIFYDGNRREVEKIDENSIMLKDLDAPDYGGVLLGTSDIFSYKGWQDEMNAKGFEIISKAETVEQEKDLGPITMRKVGDFYEMYDKNAQIAADILDLHLTAKNGEDMVGFPDSVKDDYADKLRENGYSVFIEESFEINPPKREENLMNDISEVDKNTPENSEIEEDDEPLFIDNDVIEEIEKSENASDNRPFHEIPDIQGEQLTLFGDSVPIGEKNKPKQNKDKFAEGLFVGGVNRFTALHDEIMRGTGFQDGKFRVKQFYDEKKPTNKEFADFLKNEYGIGGHSGDDVISFVDHDSKGMYFTLRSDEKFQFTWSDVAEMTSGIIDKGEYITQNDIDSRIRNARFELNEGINADYYDETTEIRRENARKILSEYGYTENINDVSESIISTESEITIDTVQIGDRFRNRETGEISEIVGLTGALPWYTEDCTVKRESEGFVITQNIPYSKILDSNLYDYIGKNEIAIEEVKSQAPEKAENFTITDDNLGNGGAKTKFKNNISAIETLKALENEKRSATIEEKNVLAQYVGWGGIPQAFDKNNSSWEKEYTQLKDLLTESEYSSARASVLDAFFTSPTIVDGIYEALANFGFEGGNVLEPAMGIGNFFGRMPEEMRTDSKLYGMEIDSISGRIAKQLYPDADIAIKGFEHNNFQDGSFDVAIGNVPFGELSFKDNKHNTTKLHDYFFAETLDKVKDGGIVAFVTSAGTLDKRDESTRKALAEKADFIGAIRLPGGKDGAFKENAGTEVTTDIIFLQKKGAETPEKENELNWISIGETEEGLPINSYFAENPDMVLGKVVEGNKLYGSGTMVIAEEGADLKEQIHTAVSKLTATISDDKAIDVYAKTSEGKTIEIPSNLRNYSFFEKDNNIYFKTNNAVCHCRYDAKNSQFKRAKAFIALRDITRELLDAQELNKSDDTIKGLQVQLNAVYDDFYKKYGLIHSQTNKRYFSDDVSYNLVAGLEKKYDKTKLIEKSDIFFKRTIQPPKAVEHVETGIEALTLSIAERAGVDFEYMSNLTGMTEDELKHDLQGEIYKIPHSENAYQTASEYLSGDIREKLRIAEEIAEYDADFIVNVNALKAAMPTPLKAGDIDVKLGATWIDPKYYEQFMYETFQTPREHRNDVHHPVWQRPKLITAEYSEHSGSWHIGNKSYDKSVIAMQQYGTRKMGAYEIMEHLLNLKEPKIYKTIEVPDGMGDVKEKRVVDIDATRVVQKKADKIRDEFKKWIFKDSTRREEIVAKYNDLFNSTRPREYDGSALKFPMMNSDIKLHEHQKNAIAHAMFGGNTLFAHCVGAGKTFEMIATAMESKRLGLCTKSLFAVPNHLTEQIGDDFQKLYPSANILVATKKDFQKENRQQLFAKIATGNFDAVIIGHSQLGMIPISKERQEMELQSQIDDILLGIEELNKSEGSRFQIKAMERTKKSLDKQLDKLKKNHDDTITFEQLGVDKLFVDEAHEFKNLFCPTKLNNISGISNSASQKALDLYLKCRYLDEKTDGKGVVFATGTPLSNSVTELHTMMRYLEYDYLKSKGLQHFDNWVTVVSQQKGRQIQLFILTLFCGNRRFLLSASLLLINL